jgi:hypothetical protein
LASRAPSGLGYATASDISASHETLLRMRALRRTHAAPQHDMLHFCICCSELSL